MRLHTKPPKKKRRSGRKSLRPEEMILQEKQKHERRRRIKRVIWCVIMIALAACPAIFMNTPFGYLPAIVIAVMLAVSFCVMKWMKRMLTIQENSDISNCQRGTDSSFIVRLKNRCIFVFTKLEIYFFVSDIYGEEDSLSGSTVTLAPFEDREFRFGIHFDHIGTYSAGLRRMIIHDMLGLFQTTVECDGNYKLRVAPKIFDVSKLHVSNSTFTESTRMLIPNPAEGYDYTGVRDYVVGDPMKTVHWKLSSRMDHYVTKQYESYGNSGLCVIMDFQSPQYDNESMMSIFDGVVETALSLEQYAWKNGMECELLYYNRKFQKKKYTSRSNRDVFSLISDLPPVTADRNPNTGEELLAEESRAAYAQGNLAFCTANVTRQLPQLLITIKQRRRHPMLFVIVPSGLVGVERRQYLKPLRQLDYARIPYYVLETAQELEGGERHVS